MGGEGGLWEEAVGPSPCGGTRQPARYRPRPCRMIGSWTRGETSTISRIGGEGSEVLGDRSPPSWGGPGLL